MNNLISLTDDILKPEELSILTNYTVREEHKFNWSEYPEEYRQHRRSMSLVTNYQTLIINIKSVFSKEIENACTSIGIDYEVADITTELVAYNNKGLFALHKDAFESTNINRRLTCIFTYETHYNERMGGEIVLYDTTNWQSVNNFDISKLELSFKNNQLIIFNSDAFYCVNELTCKEYFSASIFHLVLWVSN